VYDASGRGVFDGNVRVEKAAQQTDAKQLSRSLLLVPKATTNVKPNLQIVADDVKCTHGATISDLEDEEVFYFLSRGISQEEARKSLVYSFGAEVVDRLPTEATRARARAVVADKLGEWASAAASS
jgi:Fe-S cluster assembly protein SufD